MSIPNILTPNLGESRERYHLTILIFKAKSEERLQNPDIENINEIGSTLHECASLSSFSWTGVPDQAECWSQVTSLSLLCQLSSIYLLNLLST